MPNEAKERSFEKTCAHGVTWMAVAVSLLCLTDETLSGHALNVLTLVYVLLTIFGFGMFLNTRISMRSFWVGTAAVLGVLIGLILFPVIGFDYTGSAVRDLCGGFILNMLRAFPYAAACTQLLGWVYAQTSSK